MLKRVESLSGLEAMVTHCQLMESVILGDSHVTNDSSESFTSRPVKARSKSPNEHTMYLFVCKLSSEWLTRRSMGWCKNSHVTVTCSVPFSKSS